MYDHRPFHVDGVESGARVSKRWLDQAGGDLLGVREVSTGAYGEEVGMGTEDSGYLHD